MYYTSTKWPSRIARAGMDGSNPTALVKGRGLFPWGIAIDLKASKLFWATNIENRIESSDLNGGDWQTVVNISSKADPTGVAVANDRIYWGEGRGKTLKSSTLDGQDVITLHTDTNRIWGVTAAVPYLNLPQSRKNHCEKHNCPHVCVLTPTQSFRCLKWWTKQSIFGSS